MHGGYKARAATCCYPSLCINKPHSFSLHLIAADVRMQAGPSVGGEVALMAFAASEPHADATTSRRTSAVGLQQSAHCDHYVRRHVPRCSKGCYVAFVFETI